MYEWECILRFSHLIQTLYGIVIAKLEMILREQQTANITQAAKVKITFSIWSNESGA